MAVADGCRFVGHRIEVRFDPEDLPRLDVYYEGRPAGVATPFKIGRHVAKAVPQATRPTPEPTGIDYLGNVQAAHEDDTRVVVEPPGARAGLLLAFQSRRPCWSNGMSSPLIVVRAACRALVSMNGASRPVASGRSGRCLWSFDGKGVDDMTRWWRRKGSADRLIVDFARLIRCAMVAYVKKRTGDRPGCEATADRSQRERHRRRRRRRGFESSRRPVSLQCDASRRRARTACPHRLRGCPDVSGAASANDFHHGADAVIAAIAAIRRYGVLRPNADLASFICHLYITSCNM